MKAALVAFAAGTLIAVAILAFIDRSGEPETLPGWVAKELAVAHLTARPADPKGFSVARSAAIATVRQTAFLGEGPKVEPTVLPAFASGPIARGPLPIDAEIPEETDVPFWIVSWRGVASADLGDFWGPPVDGPVNATFLVDGVTGDCCWLNLHSRGE